MTDATLLWSIWQALLQPFAWAFTRPGHRRFVEWITAMALNVEEHTVTQSVLALERPADWRAMERFAEYGRRDTAAAPSSTTTAASLSSSRRPYAVRPSASSEPRPRQDW